MLRFIALSGTTGVTENLYLYETDKEMVVLDCGIGFPDLEMPGVDLVIPDFSYVVKNSHKLRGIILSQGHEDHIGSLPFLLRDLWSKKNKTQIWGAALVREFLEYKFKDYAIPRDSYKINVFNPEKDSFFVGQFKVSPFRVTHSVPDTVGFLIEAEGKRIMHVPEHKMDQESVDGMSFDISRAKALAQDGVLALMLDCLGANQSGFTPSGVPIEENLFKISRNAKGAIFMSAMSSSIGRFQQMINVANRLGRKVVFVGRSIIEKAKSAHKLGYLKYLDDNIVELRNVGKYSREKLVYIIAGCYGQIGSSVYRVSLNEEDRVKVKNGDVFIFSANPAPPYSKESQDFVIDELIDKGVDVHYYDLHENLHVSGHGYQEDIKALINIAKPKYLVPTGGTIRHMSAFEKLVVSMGKPSKSVFKLKPGDSIEFKDGYAVLGKKIKVKEVMVHGLGIGDIGKTVLKHRTLLGKQGVVVIAIKADKKGKILGFPEIVSRGFVFEGISSGLLNDSVQRLLKHLRYKNGMNAKAIKEETVKFLENHFYQVTARSPMIIPVVVEV